MVGYQFSHFCFSLVSGKEFLFASPLSRSYQCSSVLKRNIKNKFVSVFARQSGGRTDILNKVHDENVQLHAGPAIKIFILTHLAYTANGNKL